jgi:hypothetical protein
VIHYSRFAARGAARAPLLVAVGGLMLIAGMLGDPQAGAGTTAIAGMATSELPTISAPIVLFGRRPDRLRNGTDPADVTPPHGPAAMPHLGLALVNRERTAAGLSLLSESRMLDVIAATRAQQMTLDGLTHVRPGSTVMAVTQLLKQNAVAAAEAWWMKSPEHRDNILGPHFRQVGFGTAIDGARMYISAVFTD